MRLRTDTKELKIKRTDLQNIYENVDDFDAMEKCNFSCFLRYFTFIFFRFVCEVCVNLVNHFIFSVGFRI